MKNDYTKRPFVSLREQLIQEFMFPERSEGSNQKNLIQLYFPQEAIDHVIVGWNATQETIESIQGILTSYQNKPALYRATPDPISHKFTLIPLID